MRCVLVSFTMFERVGLPTWRRLTLLHPYFEARGHLSVVEGLLAYDRRIVIPQGERLGTLATLHEGHLGVGKC